MAENEVHLFDDFVTEDSIYLIDSKDVEKENQSLLDTFEKVQSFVKQEIIEGSNNGECRKDCLVNVKHNLRSKINDSDEESDDSDPGDESEKTSCNIKKEKRDSDFSEEDYTNSSHNEDEAMFETKIEVEYHGVKYDKEDESGDANEFIKTENIENTSPSRKREIIKGDKSNGVKNRCPHCLKEFTRKAHLKHHVESKHGDPLQRKKYKCPQCLKAYIDIYYLKKHVSRCNIKHNGFEHTCPHCPKVYINKHYFKEHVESQHGDPSHRKKYKCPQCDQIFSSIFTIPYNNKKQDNCPHCPRAYTGRRYSKTTFKTNMTIPYKENITNAPIAHRGSKELLTLDDKIVLTKQNLNRHIKSKHKST
ncbi:unnamed protein product [Brassicogethes aeneus]|uniref:C2H2-type domain-containing protein n=1 Tax=Brassicogethes aeneus TaxID=1431903 RepID=A0A9P0BH51_BRAAE|nr:unnamed protein product [Brassicogethes aeneus]